jgi:TM1410 hypothetical-related protein.
MGFFLDTLDNAQHLETTDPVRFKGMQEAAVHLVQVIHCHYPEVQLIQNRGLFMASQTAPWINGLLAENLLTEFDFKQKTYLRTTEEDVEYILAKTTGAKQANTSLKLLSLDFWDMDKTQEVENLYREAEKLGFSPYVSTIELNGIFTR